MQKILLNLSLLAICFTSRGQYFTDPLKNVYWNDSLIIESSTNQSNVPPRVHDGSKYDKTNDNIYFSLKKDSYMLYLPENHTYYHVYSLPGKRYMVGEHLCWFIKEIRRKRNEVVKCNVTYITKP